MDTIVDLEKLFHRSKERIKVLGEVFTPEAYVEDMLDLLAKDKRGVWSDEETVFFEPCSGHGNIVIAILKRRLDGIYRKAQSHGTKDAALYAVANSINTIWAIDIDSKNVENTRTRVLSTLMEFLTEKLGRRSFDSLLTRKTKYFAHILAAICWQIAENETLSAMVDSSSARTTAGLTKLGKKWFLANGHRQIDFQLSWTTYFKRCDDDGIAPLEFERASRFLNAALTGQTRGFEEFNFAKSMFPSKEKTRSVPKTIRNASAGV